MDLIAVGREKEAAKKLRSIVHKHPDFTPALLHLRDLCIDHEWLELFLEAAEDAQSPVWPPAARSGPDASLILVEPLSERELEVLQLIAEGLTNQEIASRLFLSLNTIKAHTRNIYGKLGVHSRTKAVARARSLELLPFF